MSRAGQKSRFMTVQKPDHSEGRTPKLESSNSAPKAINTLAATFRLRSLSSMAAGRVWPFCTVPTGNNIHKAR
jgi:hypothetical protein